MRSNENSRSDDQPSPQEMASRLKERVYVTFTALAVLLAMNLHSHDPKPGASAVSLLVTVAAILLAGLVADLISHSTVHAALPTRAELRHQLEVAWGAGGAIVGPLILLGLSALGVFSTSMALIWGQWMLVAALAFFAWLSLRRSKLGFWRTLWLMFVLVVVGVVVIALQLLAHS